MKICPAVKKQLEDYLHGPSPFNFSPPNVPGSTGNSVNESSSMETTSLLSEKSAPQGIFIYGNIHGRPVKFILDSGSTSNVLTKKLADE